VTGGAGTDSVVLRAVQVGGRTRLSLGDGSNTVYADDSRFAGPFYLAGGRDADNVYLDTVASTTAATEFLGPVLMYLGAGDDSLTLAGTADVHQSVVVASTFVAHTGAGGFSISTSSNVVFLFGIRLRTPL
jgi:hypothetical protein